MILDPKQRAIEKAVETITSSVAKHMATILPKVLNEVFEAGGIEYARALTEAMNAVAIPSVSVPPLLPTASPPSSWSGTPGKDGRAPRGSIRRAVVSALASNPDGYTSVEVVARAMERDPQISAGGIHNELNRNKGRLYLNKNGHWRLIPGLKLGGEYYDLLNPNPERDEATEPAQL